MKAAILERSRRPAVWPSRALRGQRVALPLLPTLRALFALISLIVLALAVYLIWTWYKGDLIVGPQGTVYKARDEWRLWVGLGLLAWSFLGRLIVPLLLARTDSAGGERGAIEWGCATLEPVIDWDESDARN